MRDAGLKAGGIVGLCAIAFIVGLLGSRRVEAEAVLTLTDGRTFEGKSVRRDGDLYLLELPSGDVVSLPVAIVETVGLKSPPRSATPPAPQPGVQVGDAQVLAGQPVAPPSTGDQLAVLGKPSEFQGDPVRSNYRDNTWQMDPSQHNWAPSTWAKDVVDTHWEPTSGFKDEDVLEGSRSEFAKSPINNSWQPTDGFAKR